MNNLKATDAAHEQSRLEVYMYKVISISDDEMTRNVELENCDTGTIEECFDDSALISDINFDFLTIGKEYECKIKLFG